MNESLYLSPDLVEIDAARLISALHRDPASHVTFYRQRPWKSLASMRTIEAEAFLPSLFSKETEDALVGINGFKSSGTRPSRWFPEHKAPRRKEGNLKRLNAAFVELEPPDGHSVGDLQSAVVGLIAKNGLPHPNLFLHSGRSLWLLWRLCGEEADLPPLTDLDGKFYYGFVQRHLASVLSPLGGRLHPPTVPIRCPGSANSHAGKVRCFEVVGRGPYNLRALSHSFGGEVPDMSPARGTAPNRIVGRIAMAMKRIEKLKLLEVVRRRFTVEQTRSFLYIMLLTVATARNGENVLPSQLRAELSNEGKRIALLCEPPLHHHVIANTVNDVVDAHWTRKLTNQIIANKLEITREESEACGLPWSSHFGVPMPPPPVTTKREEIDERRARIRSIWVARGSPGWTVRQCHRILTGEHGMKISVSRLADDLRALDLPSRLVA